MSLAAYCGFPVAGGRSQIDFVPRDPRAFPNAAAGLGVEFSGPKMEAMGNMGPFENFLLLVGKVPGSTQSCPAT